MIDAFEKEGNKNHPVPDAKFEIRNPDFEILHGKFSADEWKAFDEKTKQDILMEYRLAYCGYGEVNWCEALGTVLANDEVINGVSERGGYPVVKKKLRQWYLRITEYADRLLEGLETVDFSECDEGNANQLDREKLWSRNRFSRFDKIEADLEQ